MILQETTNNIEQEGFRRAKVFGMQQSKKAFSLLSGLYSDIHLAIVRELGCNAMDSHISVGKKDVPFLIHLPNTLEPWLTIEDFGSGISDEDIYSVYSQYFASTKTKTNDQIGCMGLGSKSPFAYTDTFTIQSIFQGEKRIYNAFFNEDGLPTIAEMGEKIDTTESNGVKIQIPVKQEDFAVFKVSVEKAFRFFEVKPTITGGVIDWKFETPRFSGTDWNSYDGLSHNSNGFAVMGGVAYPIDRYKIGDYKKQDFLSRAGVVMFFEMGELDFTPSRESLEYSSLTLNSLNIRIQKVMEEFVDVLAKNVDEQPNILEAIRTVIKINSSFSFIPESVRSKAAVWKGHDINNPITFISKLITDGVENYSYSHYSKKKYRISNIIHLGNEVEWFINDLAKGSTTRIRNYIRETNKIVTVFSENDSKKLIQFGFPDEFKKVSDMPKPVVNRSGYTRTQGIVVYGMGYSGQSRWDSEEFDPNDPPKYYIRKESHGWDFDCSTDKLRCSSKDDIYIICNQLDIKTHDIVLVAPRNVKHLEAAGVINFQDYLETINLEYDKEILAYVNNIGLLGSDPYYSLSYRDYTHNEHFKELSDTHPFKEFVIKYRNINQKSHTTRNFYKLFKNVDSSIYKDHVLNFETDKEYMKILLEGIDQYSWNGIKAFRLMREFEKLEQETNKNLLTNV